MKLSRKFFIFFLTFVTFSLSTLIFIANIYAQSQNWGFYDSSRYIFNADEIEISSGQVQLKLTTPPDSWYDNSWNYRNAILIDNSQNSSDLSDYQIEVNLDSSNFNFDKAQTGGQDFRFVDSDGATLLAHLRKSYSLSQQTASFIVQIPTILASATKTIHLYYGNSTTFDLYQYFRLSVGSITHDDYGLSYPVTYQFSIPASSSGLKVYRRYAEDRDWTQMTTKTTGDFYNGIQAVRFDYSQNRVYVSVTFDSSSDEIHLKITDSSDQIIDAVYQGIPDYYDNRDAAVVVSSDDWSGWGISSSFTDMSNLCSQNNIWMTAGIYETNNFTSGAIVTLQTEINDGYFELASHSRSHPPTPYSDYDSEIQGSKSDIVSLFNFPALNKKGDQDYIYVWIEPGGYSDDQVRVTLGENKYLISRSIVTNEDTYSSWDSLNGLYNRVGVSIWADDQNICDWADEFPGVGALNSKFDSVVTAGNIYHLAMHPNCITAAQLSDHFDYIKEKKNLWYAGFGHLYLYHYLDDQDKISVVQAQIEENQDQSLSPEPSFSLGLEVRQLTYAVSNPSIEPISANFLPFTSLLGFTPVAVENGGQIKYQISNNSGSTWYWWDGSAWVQTAIGYFQTNLASEINTNISNFSVGDGRFLFRAYLHSNGNQLVQLSNLAVSLSSLLSQLRLIDPGSYHYTNSSRPVFKWIIATTPTTGGLLKYKLEIDNGLSGDFTIDNIPVSRTLDYQTSRYFIRYENFFDSASIDSYIFVYTKSSSGWETSQNDGSLKEGRRSWKVIAYDTAGNSQEESRVLFVDSTGPSIQLTKINQQPFSQVFNISSSAIKLFGRIIDPLGGDQEENKIASGPKQIEIKIEKANLKNVYQLASFNVINSYWLTSQELISDNNQNGDDKYSPFSYTIFPNLPSGKYQITLTGKDRVGNFGQPLSFTLSIKGGKAIVQLPEQQNKPTPTITTTSRSAFLSPISNWRQEIVGKISDFCRKIVQIIKNGFSFLSRLFKKLALDLLPLRGGAD